MIDLKSFQMGLAMGLSGKPLPLAKKEPIAYLYNGVELPDINEVWTDKEKYPYAWLCFTEGKYYLVTGSAEAFVSGDGIYAKSDCLYIVYLFEESSFSWDEIFNYSISSDYQFRYGYSSYLYASNLIWCQSDIQEGRTGPVYLAASEPVPVYE